MAKTKKEDEVGKEVAQKPASNVSTYVSDTDDFGDMDSNDIIIPRAAIMQGTSPLVQDGVANVAQIWDSTQQRLLIDRDEVGKIIPLVFFKDWIEWNPDRTSDEKILDRSRDPKSKLAERARNFEKVTNSDGKEIVAVTENYNFFCIFPEPFGLEYDAIIETPDLINDCILWFSFNRTAHKLGKLWLNRLRSLKAPDPATGEKAAARMFAAAWDMSSKKREGDGNTWFVPIIGNYTILPVELVVALSNKASELKSIMDQAIERDTEKGAGVDDDEPVIIADEE